MPHNEQHVEEYHRGDALDIIVTVVDDAGEQVDITDAQEIDWLLLDDASTPETDAVVTKTLSGGGIDITDGLVGEFTVHVDTGDTDGVTAGTFHHRARVTDADGDRTTVLTGDFKISY